MMQPNDAPLPAVRFDPQLKAGNAGLGHKNFANSDQWPFAPNLQLCSAVDNVVRNPKSKFHRTGQIPARSTARLAPFDEPDGILPVARGAQDVTNVTVPLRGDLSNS